MVQRTFIFSLKNKTNVISVEQKLIFENTSILCENHVYSKLKPIIHNFKRLSHKLISFWTSNFKNEL